MRARIPILAAICALALVSLAQAETIQKGSVRISLDGKITPKRLPREGSAPVRVSLVTEIAAATKGKAPPQLTELALAINRYGHLEGKGLPICEVADIQPATTQKAKEACGGSLVGRGSFQASLLLPEQSPFPARGELYAFYGTYKGKPAILAHVYGTDPVPTSFTLPFVISKAKGIFGTLLTAKLPRDANNSVTGLELELGRSFRAGGKARSFASASCPAPKGFPGATFSFARASYEFAGGRRVSSTLRRSCGARG
jgi:hypothetical protein